MKGLSTFNGDAELASDTGRELGLPAILSGRKGQTKCKGEC